MVWIAATIAAVTSILLPAEPASASTTYHGCPGGWVCIYPQDAGWNGDNPSLKFYAYGYYNLSNMYGTHRVFNNQTGGAYVWLCDRYNGHNYWNDASAGIQGWNNGYGYQDFNLTPVNSIVLSPSISGCIFDFDY